MQPSPKTLGWSDQGQDGCSMWHMGEKRNAYRVLVVNLKKRENLKHLGVDGSIILKLVINTHYGRLWNEFIWLRTEKSGDVL